MGRRTGPARIGTHFWRDRGRLGGRHLLPCAINLYGARRETAGPARNWRSHGPCGRVGSLASGPELTLFAGGKRWRPNDFASSSRIAVGGVRGLIFLGLKPPPGRPSPTRPRTWPRCKSRYYFCMGLVTNLSTALGQFANSWARGQRFSYSGCGCSFTYRLAADAKTPRSAEPGCFGGLMESRLKPRVEVAEDGG